MGAKHINESFCPSCDEKLARACRTLNDWFNYVRSFYPEAHISCSFRDELEQSKAFEARASLLKWPESKHNKEPAEALDLFQLMDGKAVFDPLFYASVWDITEDEFPDIRWGGLWTRFKDFPHFEVAS